MAWAAAAPRRVRAGVTGASRQYLDSSTYPSDLNIFLRHPPSCAPLRPPQNHPSAALRAASRRPPADPCPSPPTVPRSQTTLEQGGGATLVGTDRNGNRYFEKLETESNRDRWVVFADTTKNGQDPSSVPPEWHGWLHHITDANEANSTFERPIYEAAAPASRTNTPLRHTPKGSWFAPQKRNWVKYQVWDPSTAPARVPKA